MMLNILILGKADRSDHWLKVLMASLEAEYQ